MTRPNRASMRHRLIQAIAALVVTLASISARADTSDTIAIAEGLGTMVLALGEYAVPDMRIERAGAKTDGYLILAWPMVIPGYLIPHTRLYPLIEPQLRTDTGDWRFAGGIKAGIPTVSFDEWAPVIFVEGGGLYNEISGGFVGGGIGVQTNSDFPLYGFNLALMYRHTWTSAVDLDSLSIDIFFIIPASDD